MKKIFYITGNNYKFKNAKEYAKSFGIELVQKKLKITEIQSDSIEDIAKHKAEQAFKILKKPLVVSDSGWSIPSLKGFPGPYMRYINKWFEAEDFLKLMKGQKDKSVILEHVICAACSKGLKMFKKEIKGGFINKPRGRGLPSDTVIKLGRCKNTIAEGDRPVEDSTLWKKVYQWFEA
jgi:non-canonical purine NTP pyrophosphatase (RdgB/HAM1 family)